MDYHNESDFNLEVRLQVLLTGINPVDREPNERQRVYIAKDYSNENFSPDEARQFIVVPKYCSDWNLIMPLCVEHNITPFMDPAFYCAATIPYEVLEPHGIGSEYGYFCVSVRDSHSIKRAIVMCLINILEYKKCQQQQ